MMRTEYLDYFLACSDEKSISKAALKLNIAQQSLSNIIKNLETEIGYELFVRSRKGITLTPAGEEVYKFAQNVMSCKRDLDINLLKTEHDNNELTGEINLGYFTSFNESLLPKFVLKFTKDFPLIKVNFTESETNSFCDVFSALIKQEIDIGLICTFQRDDNVYPLIPENLNFVPLNTCSPVLWISKDNPLSNQKEISFSMLRDTPLILTKKIDPGFQQLIFGNCPCELTLKIFYPHIMEKLVSDNQAVCLAVRTGGEYIEHMDLFKGKSVYPIPLAPADSYLIKLGYIVKSEKETDREISILTRYLNACNF